MKYAYKEVWENIHWPCDPEEVKNRHDFCCDGMKELVKMGYIMPRYSHVKDDGVPREVELHFKGTDRWTGEHPIKRCPYCADDVRSKMVSKVVRVTVTTMVEQETKVEKKFSQKLLRENTHYFKEPGTCPICMRCLENNEDSYTVTYACRMCHPEQFKCGC